MANNPYITRLSCELDNAQRIVKPRAQRLAAALAFTLPPAIDRYFVCQFCNKPVRRNSNNQKFCEKCGPEFNKASRRAWERARPLATKAGRTVQKAVKEGLLPHIRTLRCFDCGKRADHYDHRDYTKPLDVVPTCHGCNRRRGPGHPYNTEAA